MISSCPTFSPLLAARLFAWASTALVVPYFLATAESVSLRCTV